MTLPPESDPSSARVLVVDDDADIRDLLAHFLEVEGFHVASARNGQEAIDRLRQGDRACVILLDLMMPIMNGWQFRSAQKEDPALAAIPVVVISAVVPDHAPPIDANAYMRKPLDLDRLLTTVRTFCRA